MAHVITLDPHPPNPDAPWLIRTTNGEEWHVRTQFEAETQLRTYIAGRNLVRTEAALIEALEGYKSALTDSAGDARKSSYRRVQNAVETSLPNDCLPRLNWNGPPTYIA